jgi:hypothetical protein
MIRLGVQQDKLHEKQGLAYYSRATEMLYGGAAGGGKSHLMRVAAKNWCLSIPGLQVYIFRRLSGDLYKNHMEGPSSFKVLLKDQERCGQVKFNDSKYQISFSNGSKIHLCHCQYEKDRYKYQGAEIHVLMIDELTHFTEKIYTFLRGRCRIGALPVPDQYKGAFPRILCGSNPGGIGHTWVKHTFVDYAPQMKLRRCRPDDGGMIRQYIPARLEDNPTLIENDPLYEMRLQGLGDAALVKAMREGDWDIVAGGAVDDVWRRDIHVINPFLIPKNWHVDRSFDWGSSHPFSVGWWAESNGEDVKMIDGSIKCYPAGTLFRIQELYGCQPGKPNTGLKKLAKDVAKDILRYQNDGMLKRLNVKPGPADSSIFNLENGMSISKDMKDAGVSWLTANKSPGSRKNGLELLRTMLSSAIVAPGEKMEEPGLFVFNNCTEFIRTVPVLPRKETDPEDVDTASEDHIYDEVRYRVLSKSKPAKVHEQ